MDYHAVKLVHQTAVALSIGGFFVRGAASLAGARWVGSRAAKTLPHGVDTVLLVSALALAWMLRLTPDRAPWLAARLIRRAARGRLDRLGRDHEEPVRHPGAVKRLLTPSARWSAGSAPATR